ncbi:MAG TPA: PDC sensor domain-containing protein [Myxococcaceae bacterium]|nr:PDC sensor domain-containing protein [Myxococcaceae bacterium]
MSLLAVGMVGLALAQSPSPRPDEASLKERVARSLPVVREMAAAQAVVSAVVAQDQRKQSMATIQKIDKEWIASRGVTDFIRKHIENPCAHALREIAARNPAVVEAFAMDDQGALVCTIAKTTDYWQGDEAKWQRSFAGGRGAEFVDGVQYDESSQAYCVQISVPVRQGGQVVGALTVGFDLDRMRQPLKGKKAP